MISPSCLSMIIIGFLPLLIFLKNISPKVLVFSSTISCLCSSKLTSRSLLTMNELSSLYNISFIVVVIIVSLKCVFTIEKKVNLVNGLTVLDKSSSNNLNLVSIKTSSSSK